MSLLSEEFDVPHIDDRSRCDDVLDPREAVFGDGDSLDVLGSTHFIGIGGAGMSVLAEMLHESGVCVDGSDRVPNAKTDRLASLGIDVQFGQKAENVRGARTVVYSSAIKPSNPEIVEARRLGLRIVHRSDILALLMVSKTSVSVAGAHGKTTTSSLLAHILVHAGVGDLADPGYAIGGSIQNPHGEALDGGHAGRGKVLVAECDESDGSFEKYRPQIAVIVNAEADHLDHYGNARNYQKAFVAYASHASGAVVMSADDEGSRSILASLPQQVADRTIAYTTDPALDEEALRGDDRSSDHAESGCARGLQVVHIVSEHEDAGDGNEGFTIELPPSLLRFTSDRSGFGADLSSAPSGLSIPVRLSMPGIHNARNATAAIVCAALLGMDPQVAASAASGFRGASRRFEIKGEARGVTVVDDYAHHPTEIDALLTAARRRYPQGRLRVLFQPHLFSRTRFFVKDFAQALALADDVVLTSIYPARERQSDFPGVTSQLIVDEAGSAGCAQAGGKVRMQVVPDMREAAKMLALRAQSGDVLFTVGAGDVTAMGKVMLCVLQASSGEAQVNGGGSDCISGQNDESGDQR